MILKNRHIGFLTAILIILMNTSVFAIIPDNDFYVNDYVGIINDTQKSEMVQRSEFLYGENGVQVVTVIVPNVVGGSLESYANKIFNEFGIGSKKDSNGVLLLVATEDREVRIEVGDGISGVLSDSATGKLIDNYFIPAAQNDGMGQAAYETHMRLLNVCAQLDTAGGTVAYSDDNTQGNAMNFTFIIFAFFIILLFIFILTRQKNHIPPGGGNPPPGGNTHNGDGNRNTRNSRGDYRRGMIAGALLRDLSKGNNHNRRPPSGGGFGGHNTRSSGGGFGGSSGSRSSGGSRGGGGRSSGGGASRKF